MEMSPEVMVAVFGDYDSNIRKIEHELKVSIINRDGEVKITGTTEGVRKAVRLIHQLIDTVNHGVEITTQNIDYNMSLPEDSKPTDIAKMHEAVICKTVNGRWIRPKTMGQKKYVDMIVIR